MNGSRDHRLPGALNVSFAFVEGESLLMSLKDLAISSGSACTSASLEPPIAGRLGLTMSSRTVPYVLVLDGLRQKTMLPGSTERRHASTNYLVSPLFDSVSRRHDLDTIEWAMHYLARLHLLGTGLRRK